MSARWRKDCYEVRLNISKYFQNFLRDRNKIFTATTPGLEQHQLTPVKNIFLMQLFLTVYWNNALHRFCISYEMKTTMFGIWSKGMVLYFHFFVCFRKHLMLVCLVRNLANIPDNRGAQRWRKKYNIFTLTIDDTKSALSRGKCWMVWTTICTERIHLWVIVRIMHHKG